MAGKLTVRSSGSGELLSGHSWIEYTPDGGETKTYGTWGNDPLGTGNGLFENIESGRDSDASRSQRIDDAQEKALMQSVESYKSKGAAGWGYLSPCSTFAADAWKAGTGESLGHRSGIISNPSKLKASINAANARDLKKAAKNSEKPNPERPANSRRQCRSSLQSCGKALPPAG